MSKNWSTVRLDEVLTPVAREEAVDAMKEYRLLGIRLDGQGPFLRETVTGAQTSAAKLFRVAKGDFIYSRLFAWRGAFGVIEQELDGCHVSGEFPTFRSKDGAIDVHFLRYWFRLRSTLDRVEEDCTGSTPLTRNRFKENFFLDLEIPLPPPEEQRQIVAQIEELAAKVEEAQILRRDAVDETEAMLESALNRCWSGQKRWNRKRVGMLAKTVSGQVDPRIEPYASLPHINGEVIEPATCRLLPNYRLAKEDGVTSGKYHFRSGAILYSKIRPYLRKAVQVPFEGICSADVYAFEEISAEIDARFFMYSLVAPPFTEYANAISGRTRMPKLNQDQLFAFELSYPDLGEQREIVTYLDDLQGRVNGLKEVQAETSVEINALMPSVLDKAFRGEL